MAVYVNQRLKAFAFKIINDVDREYRKELGAIPLNNARLHVYSSPSLIGVATPPNMVMVRIGGMQVNEEKTVEVNVDQFPTAIKYGDHVKALLVNDEADGTAWWVDWSPETVYTVPWLPLAIGAGTGAVIGGVGGYFINPKKPLIPVLLGVALGAGGGYFAAAKVAT